MKAKLDFTSFKVEQDCSLYILNSSMCHLTYSAMNHNHHEDVSSNSKTHREEGWRVSVLPSFASGANTE